MNADIILEQFFGNVSKDKFRQNANKLLNECFILKECSDTKNSYYFILKEKDLFNTFFDLLGYELIINDSFGIISLNNIFGTGRIKLRKLESILLLIVRLIYIEEKKKLSQNDAVIVQTDEIYDRYRSLTGSRLKKHEMKSTLGMLKRYHIINNIDTDMGDPETRIQIYSSVILSLDSGELNSVYEKSNDRMNKYMNGGESDEFADEDVDN